MTQFALRYAPLNVSVWRPRPALFLPPWKCPCCTSDWFESWSPSFPSLQWWVKNERLLTWLAPTSVPPKQNKTKSQKPTQLVKSLQLQITSSRCTRRGCHPWSRGDSCLTHGLEEEPEFLGSAASGWQDLLLMRAHSSLTLSIFVYISRTLLSIAT